MNLMKTLFSAYRYRENGILGAGLTGGLFSEILIWRFEVKLRREKILLDFSAQAGVLVKKAFTWTSGRSVSRNL